MNSRKFPSFSKMCWKNVKFIFALEKWFFYLLRQIYTSQSYQFTQSEKSWAQVPNIIKKYMIYDFFFLGKLFSLYYDWQIMIWDLSDWF